jgi:sodium transport system permease protein
MNWRAILAVLRKELRETLRDRRTLVIMVVVPVLLYPLMLIAFEQIALFGQRSLEATSARVAVVGPVPAGGDFLDGDPQVTTVRYDTVPSQALRDGTVDAILVFPGESWSVEGTNRLELFFDGARERSGYARAIVHARVDAWSDAMVQERLRQRALPADFARPVTLESTSVATPRQVGGYMLGRFLPLLLILMTVLGAFYPSIDLAAGEKERGTLEALLTVPVPADHLVIGKFVAAALMGLTAAALNLGSMLLTFQTGIVRFGGAVNIQFELPALSALLIFAVLALLAILFSATFLGIAVRSHSFKEAQNALTPVYILSLVPAMLPMMPGVAFSTGWALVPVAGVGFLFRDLMMGSVAPAPAVTAVAATACYAGLALVFAARAFGREDILFGTGAGAGDPQPGRGFWSGLRRRGGTAGVAGTGAAAVPAVPGTGAAAVPAVAGTGADAAGHVPGAGLSAATPAVPGPGAALGLAAVVALLYFYGARPLVLGLGEGGILVAQWLFLALPALLLVGLGRYAPRQTLAARRPTPRALLAGLLIIAGGMPIGWLIAWLQGFVIPVPVEFLEAMRQLVTADSPRRLLWLLLVVAVTPAICEELVFRGVLLHGLATRLPMWGSIAASAAIFGAFHLSFETAIRFLPTLWLGLLLGYAVWHSRSIFTGMLMHLVNNGLVLVLLFVPAFQERLLDPAGRPPWLLVAAAPLVLLAGLRLLPRRDADQPAVAAPAVTDA